MKIAVIATAATLLVATQASAIDLGNGLTAGVEFDGNYTSGVDVWALDVTPEVGLGFMGADFTVGTTFDMLDINEGNVFEGLDFNVEYAVGDAVTAYGEVSTDDDFEFGDVTLGMTFAF